MQARHQSRAEDKLTFKYEETPASEDKKAASRVREPEPT